MIKACLVALKEYITTAVILFFCFALKKYITIAVILFFCFPLLIIAKTIEYLAGHIVDSIESVVNKLEKF